MDILCPSCKIHSPHPKVPQISTHYSINSSLNLIQVSPAQKFQISSSKSSKLGVDEAREEENSVGRWTSQREGLKHCLPPSGTSPPEASRPGAPGPPCPAATPAQDKSPRLFGPEMHPSPNPSLRSPRARRHPRSHRNAESPGPPRASRKWLREGGAARTGGGRGASGRRWRLGVCR